MDGAEQLSHLRRIGAELANQRLAEIAVEKAKTDFYGDFGRPQGREEQLQPFDDDYSLRAPRIRDSAKRAALMEEFRDNPLPWTVWVFLGGRGAGKTHAAAEWIRRRVRYGAMHIGLVGMTQAATRKIMIKGPSGLERICQDWDEDVWGNHLGKPVYKMSQGILVWANGATATLFSGEDPEKLRGYNFDTFWADELCAWAKMQETWDMLQLCLRQNIDKSFNGENIGLRGIVSTTPKPSKLLIDLLKELDTVQTFSSTFANAANLSAKFTRQVIKKYQGTSLEAQEIYAKILDAIPGAYWTPETINKSRLPSHDWQNCERRVVGIDPAMSTGKASDETGIIVAGVEPLPAGADPDLTHHDYYVYKDASGIYTPEQWVPLAAELYDKYRCSCVVVEKNQGGHHLSSAIKSYRPDIPVHKVHAKSSGGTRAEEPAMRYKQGYVHHAGTAEDLEDLEDQMCQWIPGTEKNSKGNFSPDRVDALVYALTDLYRWADDTDGSLAGHVVEMDKRPNIYERDQILQKAQASESDEFYSV